MKKLLGNFHSTIKLLLSGTKDDKTNMTRSISGSYAILSLEIHSIKSVKIDLFFPTLPVFSMVSMPVTAGCTSSHHVLETSCPAHNSLVCRTGKRNISL